MNYTRESVKHCSSTLSPNRTPRCKGPWSVEGQERDAVSVCRHFSLVMNHSSVSFRLQATFPVSLLFKLAISCTHTKLPFAVPRPPPGFMCLYPSPSTLWYSRPSPHTRSSPWLPKHLFHCSDPQLMLKHWPSHRHPPMLQIFSFPGHHRALGCS